MRFMTLFRHALMAAATAFLAAIIDGLSGTI
jgi:hypothetical protein